MHNHQSHKWKLFKYISLFLFKKREKHTQFQLIYKGAFNLVFFTPVTEITRLLYAAKSIAIGQYSLMNHSLIELTPFKSLSLYFTPV